MTYAIILLTIAILIHAALLLSIFRGADKSRESERAFQGRYHREFLCQRKLSNAYRAEMNEILDKIAQALTKKTGRR